MKQVKYRSFKFRCTDQELQKFHKLAVVEGRSLASQIRYLLNQECTKKNVVVKPNEHPDQIGFHTFS